MSARLSFLDDRRDVLAMRWFAIRTLGPDPRALVSLAMAVVRIATGHVLHAVGALPRKRRGLPSTIEQAPAVSVIVPTYGRPELLRRCLESLDRQIALPREILVAYRTDDEPTARAVDEWSAVEDSGRRIAVPVSEPGMMHQLAAGARCASSDVVAYIDDDGVAHPDWIAELGRGFMDPTVGAVGGRIVDRIDGRVVGGRIRKPGSIRWYGRIVWGHDLETEYYGDVDWLTGANMAIRRELVVHDMRLRHLSNGVAMANDLDATLEVRRRGARVLYNPRAVVEHDTTSFRDPVLGSRVALHDVESSVANHTYALLKYLPRTSRPVAQLWGYLVGSASTAGPLRIAIELARNPKRAAAMSRRMPHAWRGRRAGARMFRAWQDAPPVEPRTVVESPVASSRNAAPLHGPESPLPRIAACTCVHKDGRGTAVCQLAPNEQCDVATIAKCERDLPNFECAPS